MLVVSIGMMVICTLQKGENSIDDYNSIFKGDQSGKKEDSRRSLSDDGFVQAVTHEEAAAHEERVARIHAFAGGFQG